jgi:putative ABC transport system permease protein
MRFLNAICPDDLVEEIEGDLLQRFERESDVFGERRARRRFAWNVLRYFRPGIIMRNRFSIQIFNNMMLRSYITIAFRNAAKSKVFSAINITGLGIGLAACLLIFQFVSFELSYDKFHDRYERIYRVTNDRFQHGKLIQHGTITYPTIGPTMAKDYPEIEMYTRMMPGYEIIAKVDEHTFTGDYCHFVDEHFLSVFSFPLLAGDRSTALKEPYSIVLTESLAKKYFRVKELDAAGLVGKVIYWALDPRPYKITGVVADVPDNSHIDFRALVSYSTIMASGNTDADGSWTWSDFRHYLVLKPGVDPKAFQAKFGDFSERYFKGDKVSGSVEKFYLQPLKDTHLYSDYEYDIARTANGKAVWAMLIVAVFILVIAWINYINLTTSRALERAKEVGVRKVMGALRSQLVRQFVIESILISFFAFIVSIVLVLVAQSPFNRIVGGDLSLLKVLREIEPSSLIILAVVMIAGVALSGFYPAFVLSSYQPVTVLKGKFQRSSRGQLLRKALVVFQFTASAALITGTLIVSQQLRHMYQADLGLNIERVMIVRAPQLTAWDSTFIQRVENYKHELLQVGGVVNAATSNGLPGERLGRGFDVHLADQASSTHYTMSFLGIDYNFFDTYEVQMIAGRNFMPTDHKVNFDDINAVIINQHAVRLLGISSAQEAIGKEIINDGGKWQVVGVVNDFHQESLKKPMEPMIFIPVYSNWGRTSVRIAKEDPKELIADMERIYKKFFPNNVFEYTFLEETYKAQYNDEDRFAKITSIFTILAIIISCLGLIGLSSYTAVQRTKEIGIRKVLGASLMSIVSLLSTDFMKLVITAIILSLPLAYLAMEKWLANYPYRIPLQWFLFALPALLILFIAIVTISFQVLKAARTNPADTLKYE